MSNIPKPQYKIWQALAAALALALQAIEEVRALARQPGPKGDKGDPGPAGMGPKDMDIDFDGERTLTFRWTRGDEVAERKIVLSHMIYRGVFKTDAEYVRGDCVTYDGSTWHCNEPTTGKPGMSKAWSLTTKRGKDGRDGNSLPPTTGPVRLR